MRRGSLNFKSFNHKDAMSAKTIKNKETTEYTEDHGKRKLFLNLFRVFGDFRGLSFLLLS